MDVIIQVGSLLLWLPLNLLIIATLLRGEYRRFPFIFAYATVEFLAAAAEVPAFFAVQGHASKDQGSFAFVWWLDEVIAQVLLFVVVMSLIYMATSRLSTRRTVRTGLIVGSVVFAAVSFLIHYAPAEQAVGIWMTPWTRDLNFAAAILDLALWALLIGSRQKDHRLLLLSGALGIQFTGEAIGEAVRQLATAHRHHPTALLGSTIMVAADIVRSYIWWRALRRAPVPEANALRAQITGR
jgi:hypothetical protein